MKLLNLVLAAAMIFALSVAPASAHHRVYINNYGGAWGAYPYNYNYNSWYNPTFGPGYYVRENSVVVPSYGLDDGSYYSPYYTPSHRMFLRDDGWWY